MDASRCIAARLLATLTRIGANTAVLVVLCVLAAFLAAGMARLGAGLDHLPHDLLVGSGSTRGHGAGGGTDIGAIKIEPDALCELLHTAFSQTGVGT